MTPLSNRCFDISPRQAQGMLVLLAAAAFLGGVYSWDKGKLPVRGDMGETPATGADVVSSSTGEDAAPDLQLYRDVVAKVRRGENYYAAAKPELLKHGFPIHSTFNWRLPTYAWLFALLPGPGAIQGLLVILAAAGLALHFQAELTARGIGAAVVSSLLLIGVVKWSLDGLAFYTQEIWAAVLVLISASTFGRKETAWRIVSISAGILALLFRELALPFCFWGAAFAAWNRRWHDAAAWTSGIVLFCAFLYWHSRQVAAHLTPQDLVGAGGGISQWLQFGGLDFVLLTARLNGLLFTAPGPILFLYLLLALLGLATTRDERLTLQLLAAGSYLAAFCMIGMTVNFYWGLLYAPLLPAGVAAAPTALRILWQKAN